MKNNLFFKIYGALIIVAGLFMLSSEGVSFTIIKYTLGVILIIGALIAITTSHRKEIHFTYHIAHALSIFFYGLSVLLFVDSIEILSYLTAILLFVYSMSEIIFCNWLFRLINKVNVKVLFIRLFLGFTAGIGTVILMSNYAGNFTIMIQTYGILLAIIGFNIWLYLLIINPRTLNDECCSLSKFQLKESI